MHILIVEDDASIRDMLTECLVEEGYEVTTAQHGQAALDCLRIQQVRPDLILLDMAMPVMNGWEFLTVQTQDTVLARIPVVMLSGAGNMAQTRDGRPQVRMVSKPIDIYVLLDLVAEYQPH